MPFVVTPPCDLAYEAQTETCGQPSFELEELLPSLPPTMWSGFWTFGSLLYGRLIIRGSSLTFCSTYSLRPEGNT